MGTEATDSTAATPSGLFPTGPPRAAYREPHRVRLLPVLAGTAGGGTWLGLFTLLGHDLASRVWWVAAAGAVAWLVALLLAHRGDRGVAVGIAVAVAAGWVLASGLIGLFWSVTGDWPLW